MELRPIEVEDLPLYEGIHCDPRMMEHLGGPLPREGLEEKLRRDVATTRAGETWVLVIVPDDSEASAGTISVWEKDLEGERITEIGWMVLPEFQGRGLATEAVGAVLEKARSGSRWDAVHAFPPVTNAPSNAICRKMGFSRIEERDFLFRGRVLRCRHWRLEL